MFNFQLARLFLSFPIDLAIIQLVWISFDLTLIFYLQFIPTKSDGRLLNGFIVNNQKITRIFENLIEL